MIKYSFYNEKSISKTDRDSFNILLSMLTDKNIILNKPKLFDVIKNSKLLMARDSLTKKIIGMATLAVFTIPTGKCGRIEDVVVHEKYRRKGVGMELINRIIKEAKRINLKKIDLTSRPSRIEANNLYKKIGFNTVETNVYRIEFSK
jgi:N-acetylglutamate synthase-like GNAT family acetyltransferase